MHEESLSGGNSSEGVYRVGNTVRKPWSESTPGVHAFMAHVRGAGVSVPRVFETDAAGWQVLEHVPGRLALDSDPLTAPELNRVGA